MSGLDLPEPPILSTAGDEVIDDAIRNGTLAARVRAIVDEERQALALERRRQRFERRRR